MSRIEYSDLTQSVLKRLFLFGLPAGVGAALFWYFGGMRYWGYLVVTLAKLLGFWTTVQFDGRDLIYQVTLEMGGTSFIAFKMNQSIVPRGDDFVGGMASPQCQSRF